MGGTMMALRAHSRGGPEQLVYEAAPVPAAGPGEALVEVHACAITFAELTWDQTWTTKDGADRTPVIPSHEVSGVVSALGDGVTGLAPGDEVYGLVDFDRDGAAAEYVAVPAAALAGRPRSVAHAEAAALPLAALTAWQALVDQAGLQEGESVLVLGAGGGVGVYAVQLAAHLGARVTASDAVRKADFVRGLGAERFIDSAAGAAGLTPQGFDVVIDAIGGPMPPERYGLPGPGGRLVTLSDSPSDDLAGEYGIRVLFFIVEPDQGELAHLAALTERGRLSPVVSQAFPLSEGRRAFESAGQPRPPGKTVLTVR